MMSYSHVDLGVLLQPSFTRLEYKSLTGVTLSAFGFARRYVYRHYTIYYRWWIISSDLDMLLGSAFVVGSLILQ